MQGKCVGAQEPNRWRCLEGLSYGPWAQSLWHPCVWTTRLEASVSAPMAGLRKAAFVPCAINAKAGAAKKNASRMRLFMDSLQLAHHSTLTTDP